MLMENINEPETKLQLRHCRFLSVKKTATYLKTLVTGQFSFVKSQLSQKKNNVDTLTNTQQIRQTEDQINNFWERLQGTTD